MVNLVKRHPVEELVGKLKSGKTITKDQVVGGWSIVADNFKYKGA